MQEESYSHESDRDLFLQQAQYLKDTGSLTPGKLAGLCPSSRLNIVFDIDHTLIFAIDKWSYPNLDKELDTKWTTKIHSIRLCKYFVLKNIIC